MSLEAVPNPYSRLSFEFGGGAISTVAAPETAFPHREAFINVAIVGACADPMEADVVRSWTDEVAAMVLPPGHGIYAGYLDPTVPDWPRAHYGENAEVLRRLKARLDPGGLFPALGGEDHR